MPGALVSLAPARRRLVLGLVAVLVVAALATAAWVFVRNRTTTAGERVDQGKPGPVLLVPGYGGSTASLQTLARALRAIGRDVTVVALPDQALGDLTDQATALGEVADAARSRTGATSVDVVGYSAGGVVARIWALEDDGARHLRRLVTLGSPFHGTDLAQLGAVIGGTCPLACQQLAPHSPVLDQLLDTTQPEGPAYLSIWSTSDDVVLPPDSAVLPNVPSPSLQSICAARSRTLHSDLPTDRQVIAMVTEALAATPIPTWTPAECARLSS